METTVRMMGVQRVGVREVVREAGVHAGAQGEGEQGMGVLNIGEGWTFEG